MVDGMLTQEEIDALLSGAAFSAPPAAKTVSPAPTVGVSASAPKVSAAALSNEELKALGDRLNQGFGAAGQSAETLIGRPVTFTPISLNMDDDDDIQASMPSEPAHFDFKLSGDASGKGTLVISVPDASVFADLLMGGSGQAAAALDDLYQSAAKEAMSNILNAIIASTSKAGGKNVSLGPLDMSIKPDAPLAKTGKRMAALYAFQIEGLREGSMLLVLENGPARSLAGSSAPAVSVKEAPARKQESVSVKQVQFPQLTPSVTEAQAKNIEILLDVPMQVTVELGRAQMMIRDTLELGTGSIIELDKLAGEPVDLLVNSRLIARGEVVVIDENFGVRVTDIISPMERIKSLQG